jgi:hypothetical protein
MYVAVITRVRHRLSLPKKTHYTGARKEVLNKTHRVNSKRLVFAAYISIPLLPPRELIQRLCTAISGQNVGICRSE